MIIFTVATPRSEHWAIANGAQIPLALPFHRFREREGGAGSSSSEMYVRAYVRTYMYLFLSIRFRVLKEKSVPAPVAVLALQPPILASSPHHHFPVSTMTTAVTASSRIPTTTSRRFRTIFSFGLSTLLLSTARQQFSASAYNMPKDKINK